METFDKAVKCLAKVMYCVAGASIIFMVVLTCSDILLRLGTTGYHRYNLAFLAPFKPIYGAYELVKFIGSVAVAFGMAHTSVEKGHVGVSIVVELFPARIQSLIESITLLLGLILFALISWQSVLYAIDLKESGEVSPTLQLPFYPFVYGIAFGAATVCLVLLIDLYRDVTKVFGK